MTLLAQITEDRRGTFAIARVDGEIDASNAAWVESRLRGLVSNQCEGLAVDLSPTTYLDSAGIAMMFALAADLRQHQLELRVVVAEGSSIARMVSLTGLDGVASVHHTLDAALADA